MWWWPAAGTAVSVAMAALGTIFGALRWRVPAPWYLFGIGLAASAAQGTALFVVVGADATTAADHGRALLLDGVGLGWAVLACGVAAGAVAAAQLLGVDGGRFTLGRAAVSGAYGFVAAAVLAAQGYVTDQLALAGAWLLWFGWLGACNVVANLRFDASARHAGGRVLYAFIAAVGTLLLGVASDHVIQGLVWADLAGAPDSAVRGALVSTAWSFSNVRRMAFVAVAFAAMGGAAGLHGALTEASDLRGAGSGLLVAGGLLVFVAIEAALLAALRVS